MSATGAVSPRQESHHLDIVVCVKRVPDTETRIRIGEAGTGIDFGGVKFIMSPYDEYAVEAALRTKEAAGKGEVTLVSLGDDASLETLRAGLAMGADKALLVAGETTLDGLATAKALSAEIGALSAPLVLCGVKAADDDQQQVGPMMATLLDRACVTGVASFEVREDVVVCHREVEGGVEIVEAKLPVVLTITKGTYDPRYASLKGIMAAKKKPLERKASAGGSSRIKVEKLAYPPERPAGRIVGKGADAVPELVRLLREEAKVL